MTEYIKKLKSKYGYNSPIVLRNLYADGENDRTIRKYLSDAVKKKEIARSSVNGVYYFPTDTFFGTKSVLPAASIAYELYIKGSNGYYSGLSFENIAGLTTQVPNIVEITTNNTASRIRQITINGQKYILRKGKVKITPANVEILPWLDWITTNGTKMTASQETLLFKRITSIAASDVRDILKSYPSRTSKILMCAGDVYALSSRES